MHGTDVSDVRLSVVPTSNYDGCEPAEHVLERHPTVPFFPRCRICGYTLQSLVTWWGKDSEVIRS